MADKGKVRVSVSLFVRRRPVEFWINLQFKGVLSALCRAQYSALI